VSYREIGPLATPAPHRGRLCHMSVVGGAGFTATVAATVAATVVVTGVSVASVFVAVSVGASVAVPVGVSETASVGVVVLTRVAVAATLVGVRVGISGSGVALGGTFVGGSGVGDRSVPGQAMTRMTRAAKPTSSKTARSVLLPLLTPSPHHQQDQTDPYQPHTGAEYEGDAPQTHR
jgi:hypothetical protein